MAVILPFIITIFMLIMLHVTDKCCRAKVEEWENDYLNRKAESEGRKEMKYIIELEPIEGTDLYRAKGANTLVLDEFGIKNILTPLEEPEPEVDWANVEVDTPILVSDSGKNWYKRYFCKVRNGNICAWANGTTSFSCDDEHYYSEWKYAKLVEVGK